MTHTPNAITHTQEYTVLPGVVRHTLIIFGLFTTPNLCPPDTKSWRRHCTCTCNAEFEMLQQQHRPLLECRIAQLTNHRTKSHSSNSEDAYIEIADLILALTLTNNSASQRSKNDAHSCRYASEPK